MHSLKEVFSSLHTKFEKGKSLHIKEIKAFHRYFKTVYDPNNLRRTIFEATKILKEKLIEKMPKLNFPSYATDIYTFALLFHTPKFPHLSSSELPLAF